MENNFFLSLVNLAWVFWGQRVRRTKTGGVEWRQCSRVCLDVRVSESETRVVSGSGGGGSRKTKDLRRLPRGVRAGGLPASVHSSAGGRRGLPRWRVRVEGDDGD